MYIDHIYLGYIYNVAYIYILFYTNIFFSSKYNHKDHYRSDERLYESKKRMSVAIYSRAKYFCNSSSYMSLSLFKNKQKITLSTCKVIVDMSIKNYIYTHTHNHRIINSLNTYANLQHPYSREGIS